jgi:HlyD family secretion protein
MSITSLEIKAVNELSKVNPGGSLSRIGGDGLHQIDDDPKSDLRVGWLVVGVFFGFFLIWSLFAHLDEAAYAQGAIAVEGHRQTIQHREGGVVSAIFVKDGDIVRPGQVLISLAPAEVEMTARSLSSQVIGLQAQHARLEAERDGATTITPLPEFASLTGDDANEARRAMHLQTQELRTRSASLLAQRAVLHQRQAQLDQTITGYRNQIDSTDKQSHLIGDELNGTQSLAAQGYASQNRVRALQRQQAGLSGQRAEFSANIARSGAQINETQMQSLSLTAERAESVAKDLRDTEYQLNDLLPKLKQAKEQLAATQIRANVAGQIVALSVFTVGGVVSPGQKLMDIVPNKAPLIIDAQIGASDFDGLAIGQETEVKISSMHDRGMPIIKGHITNLSGDSLVDEKTGMRYYTMQVTVPTAEAQKLVRLRGADGGLRAGLPVQVIVPLRKRTAFQYLTEPLSQVFWTAFREK